MSDFPRASIVMGTFNGARFLPAQLESLAAQTLAPFELIAQDDGSTDSTAGILEEFARRARFPVRVHRNPARLGFAGNFGSAIGRAAGELVFLCDQDDIWEPGKLATLVRRFADPAVLLAFSDTSRIDEGGARLEGTGFSANGFGGTMAERWERGDAFVDLLLRNPVPGMSMAFRASLREVALPIPPGWEHDYWLLLVAAAMGARFAVEREALVQYRQHAAQAVGGAKGWQGRWARARAQNLSHRGDEAERLLALRARLEGRAEESVLARISAKREHLLRRAAFAPSLPRRVAQVAAELCAGGYHRFDNGMASAFRDLLSR